MIFSGREKESLVDLIAYTRWAADSDHTAGNKSFGKATAGNRRRCIPRHVADCRGPVSVMTGNF